MAPTQAVHRVASPGRGSGGNVVAALVSFFIPGLGQLIQGRFFSAVVIFLFSGALWLILLGWIGHIIAALDAAMYKPKGS